MDDNERSVWRQRSFYRKLVKYLMYPASFFGVIGVPGFLVIFAVAFVNHHRTWSDLAPLTYLLVVSALCLWFFLGMNRQFDKSTLLAINKLIFLGGWSTSSGNIRNYRAPMAALAER